MKDIAEIHGFNGLRWEDQKKIKDRLASTGNCFTSVWHMFFVECVNIAFVFGKCYVTMSVFD